MQKQVERWEFSLSPEKTSCVGFFTDKRMAMHAPLCESSVWKAETPERLTDTLEQMEQEGLCDYCQLFPVELASKESLLRVHTSEYVESVLNLGDLDENDIESSQQLQQFAKKYNTIFLNSNSSKAALLAAGSVLCAVDLIAEGKLNHAACLVRPPGHHAEDDCAMGFCLFNNIAVAVRRAQQRGKERILIVDWDVHHGNGTQREFYSDNSVLVFNIHRWDHGGFYPGFIVDRVGPCAGGPTSIGQLQGEGYNVNLAWFGSGDYGSVPMGDAEYSLAWEKVLLPVAKQFQADIIFISAGFDAARGDPLGEMDITPKGYAYLTASLVQLGIPIIMSLEGGYNVTSVKHSFCACVAALCGAKSPHADEFGTPKVDAKACINATIDAHKPFWKLENIE